MMNNPLAHFVFLIFVATLPRRVFVANPGGERMCGCGPALGARCTRAWQVGGAATQQLARGGFLGASRRGRRGQGAPSGAGGATKVANLRLKCFCGGRFPKRGRLRRGEKGLCPSPDPRL